MTDRSADAWFRRRCAGAILRIVLLLPGFGVIACGGHEKRPPLTIGVRGILRRAQSQALRDSTNLAAAAFNAGAAMTMEFGRETQRVRIADSFGLAKEQWAPVTTVPLTHSVQGDTTLLKDMYTFRDSKGKARSQEKAQLTGLHFGADFLPLLRSILSGAEPIGCTLLDSTTSIDGKPCYLFSFVADDKSGKFQVGRDSCDLAHIEIDQQNDYWIGGYTYHMAADFRRPTDDVLVPVKALTEFSYSRFFTKGTGSILVLLNGMRAAEPNH
ncbi:MAG: hypothetical protein JWQ98_1720 [Chlorobi bacterium]|nr:hypothetical protein [Chlorobiota bacterium]